MKGVILPALDFNLAPELEAREPPEARGLSRDQVRLLVSYREDDRLLHATFRDLPCFLEAGDVVVVNSSATRPAALPAIRPGGEAIRLHLSTRLPANLWLVELRRPANGATEPLGDGRIGEQLALPDGARATLLATYSPGGRLWIATLELPRPLDDYLGAHGRPIRYPYVRRDWPLAAYQTIFADEPGSAEMPSAGRPFTPEVVAHLVRRGVLIVPLVLHTGVASLEEHEPPYEEYYRVPPATARTVNAARAGGGRVIAVGTTVVRALETVAAEDGIVRAGAGWTDLVVTPNYTLRAVDSLLTGLHEPRSTHLAMLAALAGRRHLELAYDAALREGYLWHEFGDLHLILP